MPTKEPVVGGAPLTVSYLVLAASVNLPNAQVVTAYPFAPADISTTMGQMGFGGAPNANAQVDIQSTTKGLLIPRLTTVQRTVITSPPEGLEVYDLTVHKKYVYTGSAWEQMTSA
jgi:hypothetical protein